jgi:proprotein convertase subtilisin/kexin type 5
VILLSDYDQNTCVPCEPNCASCQERPDHCTSCDHHLVLHDNKCYAACPTYTYETEDYGYVFLNESALYTTTGNVKNSEMKCCVGNTLLFSAYGVFFNIENVILRGCK